MPTSPSIASSHEDENEDAHVRFGPSDRPFPSYQVFQGVSTKIRHSLLPLTILIGIVLSSTAQTEAAHHVSTVLGYDQPYFQFWLTHSTFSLVFPLHLLLLSACTGIPPRVYLGAIRHVIARQLGVDRPSPPSHSHARGIDPPSSTWRHLLPQWVRKVLLLTALISIPALIWYIAMALSTPMDITAIYASSSFSAYAFSVLLLRQPLSRITLASVGVAFVGVLVISLDGLDVAARAGEGDGGGSGSGSGSETGTGEQGVEVGRRMLGDGLMLLGSIALGLYEVIYKLALPDEPGSSSGNGSSGGSGFSSGYHSSPAYTPLPQHHSPPTSPTIHHRQHPHPHSHSRPRAPADRESGFVLRNFVPDPPPHDPHSSQNDPDPSFAPTNLPALGRTTSSTALLLPAYRKPFPASADLQQDDDQDQDWQIDLETFVLPPALHANFLTTCIGLATLLCLWPPIVWLHWTGYEPFVWPSGWRVWVGLEAIAWGGSLYNAGLMALIGIWGPTISSVANLLTIGAVALIDALLTGIIPDLQTLLGVGMICAGFGVLLWEEGG